MMNILAIKSTGDTTSMSVILQNEINTLNKKVSSIQSSNTYVTTGQVGGDFVANAGDQNRSYGILKLLQNTKNEPTLNIGLDKLFCNLLSNLKKELIASIPNPYIKFRCLLIS